MRQRRQLQDRTRTLTAEQLEYQHDSESYRRPTSAPVSRPSTRPTPTSSPYDYADPPASQSSGRAPGSGSATQSGAGRDESENNEKPKTPASSQPSTSGFPQDIEWSPEDDPSGIVPFIKAAAQGTRDSSEDKTTAVCEALYAADPEGVARGVKIMTGCEPDEEQDVLPALISLARNVGMDDYLTGVEAWYTTRLGPVPSSADAALQNDYIDMAFSDDIGILRPGRRIAQRALREGASETKDVADSEGIDPYAEFRPDPSELNERTVQFLHEKFPDAKLRTREGLQGFFQERLTQLVPEFDDPEIGWDVFSTEELVAFYYSALNLAMEMYTLPNDFHYMMDERAAVAGELGFVEDLFGKAAKTPLEDLDALLEAYGWESEADAVSYFRPRVGIVYSKLGRELPPGWEEFDDPVVMANMLYDGVEEMEFLLESGETFLDPDDPSAADWGMIDSAALFLDSEPKTLTGTSNQSPDLTLFLFVASIFFEPLDWALTTGEVIDAVSRGDIGGALGTAFLGVLPGVPGTTGKVIRHGIDAASDTARAVGRVARTAEDFAVKFNKFNLSSADDFYVKIQNHEKIRHLSGDALESALWKEARRRASRSNSAKLRRQFRWAVKEDRYLWEWRVPEKGQDAHHIVPSGDRNAIRARQHMQNHGISVNAAYNGVGLRKRVHYLTNSDRQVKAINNTIVNLDNPDDIVNFLDTVARYLSDLNQYADNTNRALLNSKFDEFLSQIGGN